MTSASAAANHKLQPEINAGNAVRLLLLLERMRGVAAMADAIAQPKLAAFARMAIIEAGDGLSQRTHG